MKRAMLFFERFMYIDGVTPINCVMTARVRGKIEPENLHAALKKIQSKHPLLRAQVVEEQGEPYFFFNDQTPAIPVQIVERETDEDWKTVAVSQWQIPFDAKTGPLFRVLWLRSEELSEITLVAHHCICDGGSMVTLMRELLLVTDQPNTELAPYTSYTSLNDLVPQDILTNPKNLRQVKKKVTLYKLFLAVLARKTSPLPIGNPYVLTWRADATHHAALQARCNAEGTTLYAALCVAYLQAFRAIQGKAAKNKIMCPVSIRRFIRKIKSDMMFAFAPTIELSLPKQQENSFWNLARQMKHQTGEKINGMNVYEDLMVGDRMRSSVPKIIAFLRSSRGGHDIAFSNMGRLKIPAQYKNFHVEAILSSTVAVPWKNTNTLIATAYQNEMELAFISNERFLPQQEAEAIQQKAIQLLQTAMDQPSSPVVD